MTRIIASQGDITTVAVDAIVNAANSRLAGGGGVDGAIHRAGGPSILEECQAWITENGTLPTGQATATGAGDMAAQHVIHTVGPIWREHTEPEADRLLTECYRNSLDLAVGLECGTVAFPNISTGVYGFPKDRAAGVAVDAVSSWVAAETALDEVSFICFDEENLAIYSSMLES